MLEPDVKTQVETMIEMGTYSEALALLRKAELRPTRQRLALCNLLFQDGNRHVTAEILHAEATHEGVGVSLATVYNTLHQFTEVGLLRQIVVDGSRTYFDTNTSGHHHFFLEGENKLIDIPDDGIDVSQIPAPPDGTEIAHVEVVVRVKSIS